MYYNSIFHSGKREKCNASNAPLGHDYVAMGSQLFRQKDTYQLGRIEFDNSYPKEGMWNHCQVFDWPVHFLTFDLLIITVSPIGEKGVKAMKQILSKQFPDNGFSPLQSFDGWVL